MEKIWGDQPRMTGVVLLDDACCALAQLRDLASMPLVRTPIRVLTMKTPPRVTASIMKESPAPASPPMVPASRVRMREPDEVEEAGAGLLPGRRDAPGRDAEDRDHAGDEDDRTSEATASQPIRAIVPQDIELSNG